MDIKKGDRVRVTFEGEVTETWPSTGAVQVTRSEPLTVFDAGQVERVVEKFGPGDVIRSKMNRELLIVLTTDGGYTYIGPENKGIHARPEKHEQTADSLLWERVTL